MERLNDIAGWRVGDILHLDNRHRTGEVGFLFRRVTYHNHLIKSFSILFKNDSHFRLGFHGLGLKPDIRNGKVGTIGNSHDEVTVNVGCSTISTLYI